jgi:propionyl-CoA carboxylase beta chain
MDRTIPAPDIRTTAGKLADLDRRMGEAVHAGSAAAVEKQHARGKKTARERVLMLLDPDSFTELDEFARHRSTSGAAWARCTERRSSRSSTWR